MHKQSIIISSVLSCAVILFSAEAISGKSCVSLNSKIDPLFLKPFRKIVRNSESGYLSLGKGKIRHSSFEASWKKSNVGNFSTVRLGHDRRLSSAKICTTGNVRRLFLDINVGFRILNAHLKHLVISLPILTTEDALGIFTSTGSNAVVKISAKQNVTSKQCTTTLDDFKFTSWGDIELTLEGDGFSNYLAETMFNSNRAKIVKSLSKAGVGKKINRFTHDRLAEVLENHGAVMCNIMASN